MSTYRIFKATNSNGQCYFYIKQKVWAFWSKIHKYEGMDDSSLVTFETIEMAKRWIDNQYLSTSYIKKRHELVDEIKMPPTSNQPPE